MKKKMKKYIKLFSVLTMATAVTSCSDDFLKENPTTFASPSTLLVSEQGAEIYLTGSYGSLQRTIAPGGSPDMSIYWGTLGTDEVVVPNWGGERKLVYLQQVTPSTTSINTLWVNLYEALNRTNSVVDRIGAMTEDQIDTDVKNKFIAEAKFLRTTINFALVSAWENVPLIKNEVISVDDLNVSQATTEEVYEYMIADLKAAIPLLPEEQGGGRATAGAAKALLGRIYLQMTGFPLNQTDKFALAENILKEVMDSGTYDLLPTYGDVFKLDFEQSKEIIFSVGFDGPTLNEGGLLSTFYGPNGSVNQGGGWGTCFINHGLADAYEDDDARFLNNVARHNANNFTPEEGATDPASWTVGKNTWRGWKWHAAKPNSYPNDTPFDYIYLRYADVLLMYAEALNGQNKLTQNDLDNTVNRLRSRARLEATAVAPMVLGSQEDNSIALLDERRKELCLEGWRRNDLLRFGKYEEAISGITQGGPNAGDPITEFQDYEIRWPIPELQLQTNENLVQNPGY
ncbi:putative outer membrane starch-binding protein [Maribacter vaceletii]|uniref:Putative outer membrane starch-binding protein n=2 Tax=Maribacter vaceletii TaxID=1206816 RepID=A0A495ECN3_9FLAO|nr:putative outer membrane starch-binding protein [Maribacter vaceletii]